MRLDDNFHDEVMRKALQRTFWRHKFFRAVKGLAICTLIAFLYSYFMPLITDVVPSEYYSLIPSTGNLFGFCLVVGLISEL